MLTATLPRHLLAYVDAGIIRIAHARAIVAFDADAGCSYDLSSRERGSRASATEGDGYVLDHGPAVDRARRARAAMGRERTAVLRRVGIDNLSFQEAADELGYRRWEDVLTQFRYACGDLLHVYSDFRDVA